VGLSAPTERPDRVVVRIAPVDAVEEIVLKKVEQD
jgi:hypothetical protein